MVEATGCGCPVDTSVHSTEALTEAGAESGCPVDTSVHSTEAPTEAAAENLNLRHPALGAETKKQ